MKYKKCERCDGSGHLFKNLDENRVLISHCPACEGTGRVPDQETKITESDRQRREFYKGENT